jgi:hypothetical protein
LSPPHPLPERQDFITHSPAFQACPGDDMLRKTGDCGSPLRSVRNDKDFAGDPDFVFLPKLKLFNHNLL